MSRAVTTAFEIIEGGVANRGAEAARLSPAGAIHATVDWPLPPTDDEEMISPEVVGSLSRALAACGTVAFRYDDPLNGTLFRRPHPRRSFKDWLLGLAGISSDRFGLVTAADPAVAAALFMYGGWWFGAQAAIVFDPDHDPAPILDALGDRLDWRNRALPDGARLLFGPGHDGDFAVVAAADRFWMDRFVAALEPNQAPFSCNVS